MQHAKARILTSTLMKSHQIWYRDIRLSISVLYLINREKNVQYAYDSNNGRISLTSLDTKTGHFIDII